MVSYRFLWRREEAPGPEQGRKVRPACVVIPVAAKGDLVTLFLLTTQEPGSDRLALQLPETE